MPDLIWAYLLAITLLTITPGVDTLLVLRNTARGGLADGCVTSVGICTGLFIHATLSALGISMLLVDSAWAFTLLKWLGAMYLIWLGLGSLRQAFRGGEQEGEQGPPAKQPPRRQRLNAAVSLREGLLSNVLNPKTALFYMALLPQFVDPAGPAFAQSMLLAALHFALAMVWQCGLAWAVVRFRNSGVSRRLGRALSALTGGVFVAMGAKLAATA
ncbi:MAG: LysE family translocator [Pseudomonadota bacterium]|nr:LysE family translocator [Pseudomonadota bacterium]